MGSFTRDTTLAGEQSISGLGFSTGVFHFVGGANGVGVASYGSVGFTNKIVASAGAFFVAANGNHGAVSTYCITLVSGTGNGRLEGYVNNISSDGFTITWTKSDTPIGIAKIAFLAEAHS